MVVYELMIGLVIGFGATLPLYGMQIGGQVIDQQMGLSLASVISPDSDAEGGGLVNQFYFLLASTLFVIFNGHRAVLGVLVGSFDHVPLGAYRPDAQLIVMLTRGCWKACSTWRCVGTRRCCAWCFWKRSRWGSSRARCRR